MEFFTDASCLLGGIGESAFDGDDLSVFELGRAAKNETRNVFDMSVFCRVNCRHTKYSGDAFLEYNI